MEEKFDITKRYEYITAFEKKRADTLEEYKKSQAQADIKKIEYEQIQETITVLKTKSDDEIVKDLNLIKNINKILP